MFVLELLGFSLLINVGMVTANPGLCPIYPRVLPRDRTCYKISNCSADSDCKDTQKCCENPCGITLCFDIDPDPSVKIEKCPIEVMERSSCGRKRTTFCYIEDCKRCCKHESKCNPAPNLLTKAENCHSEICAKHTCPKQGSVCFVDEATSKPMCRCITSCNKSGRYVCAADENMIRTFRNNCFMNQEACVKEKTFKMQHEGRCLPPRKKVVPIQKPTVRDHIQYHLIGSLIDVNCIGDRDVDLVWVQKRAGGKDVELSENLQMDRGIYTLKGKTRKVLAIYIKNIGPASYGIYSCKQEIDNVVMETELHIRPKEEVLFDRNWCNLPRDNGTCSGNFINYYYEKRTKRCTAFRYQGCKGNENNFQTLNECKVKCGGMTPSSNMPITLKTYDEKCGDKVCRFHENCRQRRGRSRNATCVCQQECSLNPKPICASNGQTYISLCTMKVEACRWRKQLTAVYAGKCGPYQPSNDAYASRLPATTSKPLSLCQLKRCPPYAKCFVNPFTRIPLCYCPETCPFSPQIICASNRKHYLNECFMRHYSCKEKRKLTVLKKGLCLFNT